MPMGDDSMETATAKAGGVVSEDALRRAGPADAQAVRALVRRGYARWVPVIGREPRPMLADYDHAVVEHFIHVVERQGEIVAAVELVPGGDHLLIENVVVDPAAQGGGIGSRLLAFAETEARRRGLSELRLYTNALMAENRALYARRGYTETEIEQRGPYRIVHMAKSVG